MTEKTTATRPEGRAIERSADDGAITEFERLYRANVDAVTAYFARRSADPQVVADLTADTFVAVISHFTSFDPRKGTARAWVFGIARHVHASYCEAYSKQQHQLQRLAGRRDLGPDQVEELVDRIDAESGIAGANAKLRQLGHDRVVVVPVRSGCQDIGSLPAPAVPANGKITVQATGSSGGSVTVNARGIPAGDIMVVAFETAGKGTVLGSSKLTSPPAPSCVSITPPPATGGPGGGTVRGHGGAGVVRGSGGGSGPTVSGNG